MKDDLIARVRASPSPQQGRNLAREYLQAQILAALQRAEAMIPLAFHGGTALRFLYASQRYSEDLDFALEQQKGRYDFRGYLRSVGKDLADQGYAVELKASDRRVLHSALVRFPGLLHELGLSARPEEVLSVKIGVDTNPPVGAALATTVVRRYVVLQLQHHDRASLLAGKLHALLQRPYLKGRDVYDLLWYLSDPSWPAPNLTMLSNALQQTGWTDPDVGPENWRTLVRQRLQASSWDRMVADVRPLLETGADPGLLTQENLLRLLS